MASVTISVHGPVDPATAWERYARPELWSTWSPQILGVEGFGERIAVGATGTVRGPLGLRVSGDVLHVDEAARTWEWTARTQRPQVGVAIRLEHAVLPSTAKQHPGGTTTTLTVHGLAPVVLGYLPLAYVALGRLVSR